MSGQSSDQPARKAATRTLPPIDGQLRSPHVPWSVWVAFSPAPLDQEGVITLATDPLHIGRDADDDGGLSLLLPDTMVSRRHAIVRPPPADPAAATRSPVGPTIVDCQSKNGLRVNGKLVREAVLAAGDVVRLGDSILVIAHGHPAPAEDWCGLGLIGRSPGLGELRRTIRRVGPSSLSSLVIGPTGTGKELIARALHTASRRSGTLVAVNCAALPAALIENLLFGHRKGAYTGAHSDVEGAFVRSHGGTLFLDEVGDLPLESQPKLLRVLESREVHPLGASQPIRVDVRIVAATNVELRTAVQEGRFREDLYARLAGIVMRAPPLGQRREDIVSLFDHYAVVALQDRPMTANFAEQLLCYAWPGNVRELVKLTERLAVLYPNAPTWDAAMLAGQWEASPQAEESPEPEGEDESVDADRSGQAMPTRAELEAMLVQAGGNVSRVAQRVGRSRKQVYRWMDRYALKRGKGR